MVIVAVLSVSGCSETALNVGEKLPNLVFYDLDENRVSVFNYMEPGKKLLIHFWGAACCLNYSIPTIEAVSLIGKSEKFKKIEVVSVNLDYPIPKVRRIVRELDVAHTMLVDMDASYYRAEPKLRFFFPLALILVVDEKGIIQGKLMGPQLLPSIAEILAKK